MASQSEIYSLVEIQSTLQIHVRSYDLWLAESLDVEPADTESRLRDLNIQGFWHSVGGGCPGTKPPQISRDSCRDINK